MLSSLQNEKSTFQEVGQSQRRASWLNHFEELAPNYRVYRNKYNYYWNDVIRYYNYFLLEESSILQIGCGTGETLAQLKGGRKVGIDISPTMIKEAHEAHPSIDFWVRDAENIQLNEQFDVIILSNVLGYFENEPIIQLVESLGLKAKCPSQNWLSKKDIENLLYIAGFESYRKIYYT